MQEIYFYVLLGTFIPFIGTTLGAAAVFFAGKSVSERAYTAIYGFSAGVMIAASVWSLLIPAMEISRERGQNELVLTLTGLFVGVLVFILCERVISRYEARESVRVRDKSLIPSVAVAFHNLPEGMAVGAVFAELITQRTLSLLPAAMALSIGICVQNFPEGAIISIPLYSEGKSKSRSFLLGTASGAIEPVGALLTLIAAEQAACVLPFLLGSAAGAMIFAVIDTFFEQGERGKSFKATFSVCFCLGFMLMMSLDVLLGG